MYLPADALSIHIDLHFTIWHSLHTFVQNFCLPYHSISKVFFLLLLCNPLFDPFDTIVPYLDSSWDVGWLWHVRQGDNDSKRTIYRHGNVGRLASSLLTSSHSLSRSPTLEWAQATASHIKWSPMCDPHARNSCTHDHWAILTRICPRSEAYCSPHAHHSKAWAHHSLVASFPSSAVQISVEKEICCVLCADLSSFHSPFDFQLACLHNRPPHALLLCYVVLHLCLVSLRFVIVIVAILLASMGWKRPKRSSSASIQAERRVLDRFGLFLSRSSSSDIWAILAPKPDVMEQTTWWGTHPTGWERPTLSPNAVEAKQ